MLNRILRIIKVIWTVLVLCSLTVMFVTVILQVFTRYVINIPLLWTDEVSKLFFMWMVYLGAIAVFIDNTMIRLDIISVYIPARVKIILEIFFNILSFCLAGYLLPHSIKLVISTLTFTFTITKIPWAYIYLVAPTLFICLLVTTVWWIIKYIKQASEPRGAR